MHDLGDVYTNIGVHIDNLSKVIYPFQSQADFEFAKLAREAALNRKQTEQLILIINKCISGKDAFTFKDQADLDKTWAQASLHPQLVAFTPRYPYLNMYPDM